MSAFVATRFMTNATLVQEACATAERAVDFGGVLFLEHVNIVVGNRELAEVGAQKWHLAVLVLGAYLSGHYKQGLAVYRLERV